jgi:acetyl esterase/lipase
VNVGTNIVNFLAYTKSQGTKKDIAYGSSDAERLNVYLPRIDREKVKNTQVPVVVFFYGGGWSSGDKDDYRFAAEPFTSAGYIVVIPDYSKYPEFRYPRFIEDSAAAVAWVAKNIAQYGGNPERVFLVGHSAGAHIGAMLACNPKYLEQAGTTRDVIRGFAGLAGPYDFVPREPKYVEVFKPAGGDASSAMPANYIDGTQPPLLLLYGLEDKTVYYSNIESMQKKVEKRGGALEIKLYEKLDHVSLLTTLTIPFRGRATVAEDILSFFESQS